ncbi:MAG: YfhO family protein [Deltaproteobacteria bacterium]|nr:YfhO family protein [Deltaproteobacteria bacterium]
MKGKKTFYLILAPFAAVFVLLYHRLLIGADIYTHDSYIWLGSFYYFIDSAASGSFPLWDPYSLAGTAFYPTIHAHGLLDPLVIAPVMMVKTLGTSILTSYIYFYLLRLLVYGLGAYWFFKRVTGCRLSALVSSGVLVLAVAPTAFRQMGILENVFLTPFTMYFIVRFFDNPDSRRKYAYLALFAFSTGISLNVFIPAYFSFNLAVFIPALFITGIVRFNDLRRMGTDRRFLAYCGALAVLLAFMAAPTARLFIESRSPDGEHFPSVRIIQKNDGVFKKVVASDLGDAVLSEKFSNFKGVYGSAGNAVSFLYPDVFLYYFHVTGGFKLPDVRWTDFISEAFQYIGVFSFLIAVIGFVWSKSRYRYLALIMLAMIAVNMFSSYGVHSRPPNAVQSVFNKAFPLLGMMEVRETLSGFFLFYMCLLMALGLRIIFDGDALRAFLEGPWRVWVVCVAAILFKLLVTLYLFKSAVYISRIDLVAIIAVAAFGAIFSVLRRGDMGAASAGVVVIAVILGDLFYYNYTMRPYVLQPNTLGAELASMPPVDGLGFDYYRIPFVDFEGRLPLAFSEAVFRRKGAMSRSNNHHFLTTKRFYDYFTHVPLENQTVASGITAPVLRFFPDDMTMTLPTRREALTNLSEAPADAVYRYLVLEARGAAPDGAGAAFNFDRSENEPWLKPEAIAGFYNGYLPQLIQKRTGEGEGVKVTAFTPNTVEVNVTNNAPGYLYYSDGWSRWWRAYDNGGETTVVPANYNFKAVRLGPGSHAVRFVFDPSGYRYALYLYYAGLAAIAALALYFSAGARRGKSYPGENSP